MKKGITVLEAYQRELLTQREYTQIHKDVEKYIVPVNSKDRLYNWYVVDAATLYEIEEAYIQRAGRTGRAADKSKTYCTVFNNMDVESERLI